MGEALVGGVVASAWTDPGNITVVELDPGRRQHLADVLQGVVVAERIEASGRGDADAVIAVKPQYVVEVAESLHRAGCRRILSIAAGVTTGTIEAAAPGAAVVRCMPNTPALVGAGAAAIAPGSHATDADLDWAASILGAVGMVVRVDEGDMDAVTGVSGSGPAYVFRLAEALTAAGIAEGLTPEVADALTRQTLLGASRLLSESGEDPGVLRENVTSPGGTTAAGLGVFDDADFVGLVAQVVRAAVERSRELGA